jgi:hypothetical protein
MEDRAPAIGDTFYTSWGYDQTQVEFYRVVGLTPSGKSVRVVQVAGCNVATSDDMHLALVPTATKVVGPKGETLPPTTHVLLKGGTTAIKVDGHHAWLWDGKPKYATGHGYGH